MLAERTWAHTNWRKQNNMIKILLTALDSGFMVYLGFWRRRFNRLTYYLKDIRLIRTLKKVKWNLTDFTELKSALCFLLGSFWCRWVYNASVNQISKRQFAELISLFFLSSPKLIIKFLARCCTSKKFYQCFYSLIWDS